VNEMMGMSRQGDNNGIDYRTMREPIWKPGKRYVLSPGHVMVPEENIAVAIVLGSSVAVTLYDKRLKRGGLCHFIRPWPRGEQKASPVFGFPATVALLSAFAETGSEQDDMIVGVYGGAWPEWASAPERDISRNNVEVVKDVLRKKKLGISDIDVGGHRGRKIVYSTGSNEIAVVKTDKVRNTDWYPVLPQLEEVS